MGVEMNFPYTSNGWDGVPEEKTATGGETVYRAFDKRKDATSRQLGPFFFMPVASGMQVHEMTALELETELNAALWGNRFSYLAKFRIKPGVVYLIGNIAQTDYTEKDYSEDQLFQATSFITPSGLFKQVMVKLKDRQRLQDTVSLIDETRVKEAYRFVRGPQSIA